MTRSERLKIRDKLIREKRRAGKTDDFIKSWLRGWNHPNFRRK